MQALLSKTTKPFLVYVLIILLVSVPVYYFVIKVIWMGELDEQNQIMAKTTEAQFGQLAIPENELKEKIRFWNQIQPGTYVEAIAPGSTVKDSIFTASSQSLNLADKTNDDFRVLVTTIHINGKPYYFRSVTNYEDTKETVAAIAIVSLFFFGCIIAGLLVINNRLSKTVWLPFRDTLSKLKGFNLNNQVQIDFENTNTIEFNELNQSLNRLVQHTVSVYKTQKEFTENASHELQTPLAILKSKLEILLQSDELTEKQYQIVEEMNKALARSARINKNLLLLTRIDNSQFDSSALIAFDTVLMQSLDMLQEHFEQKNIRVITSIATGVQAKGNSDLTEVLVNNLLLNAIRHTAPGGSVHISLSKPVFEVANEGQQALDPALLFKRFSRFSADNNGSGLGLSIVQEIGRFHNWKVQYRFENSFHIFSVYL
jgi:signal transduction histidine kinase